MTAVKIDKDIPFPDGQPLHERYPWRELQIGDSFKYPGGSAYVAASLASKRNPGMVFKARKMPDGSYRVWRIE